MRISDKSARINDPPSDPLWLAVWRLLVPAVTRKTLPQKQLAAGLGEISGAFRLAFPLIDACRRTSGLDRLAIAARRRPADARAWMRVMLRHPSGTGWLVRSGFEAEAVRAEMVQDDADETAAERETAAWFVAGVVESGFLGASPIDVGRRVAAGKVPAAAALAFLIARPRFAHGNALVDASGCYSKVYRTEISDLETTAKLIAEAIRRAAAGPAAGPAAPAALAEPAGPAAPSASSLMGDLLSAIAELLPADAVFIDADTDRIRAGLVRLHGAIEKIESVGRSWPLVSLAARIVLASLLHGDGAVGRFLGGHRPHKRQPAISGLPVETSADAIAAVVVMAAGAPHKHWVDPAQWRQFTAELCGAIGVLESQGEGWRPVIRMLLRLATEQSPRWPPEWMPEPLADCLLTPTYQLAACRPASPISAPFIAASLISDAGGGIEHPQGAWTEADLARLDAALGCDQRCAHTKSARN
jgi:hypothetical protein